MRIHSSLLRRAFGILAFACIPIIAVAQPVTTYHNDTARTGWDRNEKTLTVASVSSGTFGLVATTTLDSQVDAQPLVIPNQTITGQGTHTVVYVVTDGDTIYAIDGSTGAILASRNFGTPVPRSALPGGCSNNGPTIGITSTPVIDTATGTLYLIADTYENFAAVFRLHAISLATLQDTIPPVIITASAKLADGTSYSFNPAVSRQRAALLLSGGNLYAGFSSYCDQAANITRGWMLGWTAATLAPLPHNQLQNSVPTDDSSDFLNAVWMSGWGPAAEGADHAIYFLTSNSDANTYGSANIDESVVKIPPALNATTSVFTDPNHASFDAHDEDLGSGGAMLAPNQPGPTPKLLFAAGKAGTMYMFNRSTSPALAVLASYPIGGCWCGPSYFAASDGVGRVVSSGGANIIVWKLATPSNAPASLTQLSSTAITSGEDPGTFTSISSDGTKPATAIIWAVGRPTAAPGTMPLYAIDPDAGDIIYTATAGNWLYGNSNADTVPTIATGHVYVATYQELAIFGLGARASPAAEAIFATRAHTQTAPPGFALQPSQHALWGIIQQTTENQITLKTRSGQTITIDITLARDEGDLAAPVPGQAAVAIGHFAPSGTLMASNIEHAKPQPSLWPRDQ